LGSAWISARCFCQDVEARVMDLLDDWRPMGAIPWPPGRAGQAAPAAGPGEFILPR